MKSLMDVAKELVSERERQGRKGYDLSHDDQHAEDFALVRAASSFALPWYRKNAYGVPETWPWPKESWDKDRPRREQLVIAGALIIAEIQRLDRANRFKAEDIVPGAMVKFEFGEPHDNTDHYTIVRTYDRKDLRS